MRFEVPQFIEVEDKIVGPLTWKQFVYLAGGAGILVILYLSPIPFIFFVIFGLPIGVLSASLAFHRVNNRPFSIFLESCVNYFRKTKLYLWRRNEMQSIIEKVGPQTHANTNALYDVNKKSITSLSRKLELHLPE